MSTNVYVENRIFNLVSDSDLIRKSHIYDDIKAEINKQNAPFSGGTDWESVKNKCTLMAEKSGMDLLLCCYYTVAVTKLHCVAGLANGLELLSASLIISSAEDKNANKRKDLVEWVNNSIIKEMKLLKPNYEKLRDLYRCERHCEQIDSIFTEKQPSHVANMDGLAYIIFEHIDRLEIQYKSHKSTGVVLPAAVNRTKTKWHYYILVILVTALITYQVSFLLTKQPVLPIHDLQFNALPAPPLAAEKRQALSQSLSDNMSNHSFSWLGNKPKQQQENIEKLESLIGDDQNIALLKQQWLAQKKESIESVNAMVDKFDGLRTRLSNVNLSIQKSQLNSVKKDIDSITKISKSLSPIYARVGYIEQLLKSGENEKAGKELGILQQRLEALTWKVAQLDELVLD
ncbi:type VI secretion system ImpA family N-terminal domain-containing protein [Vibrio rumoiensis]|uniref:type VI secretion system ImpA family N-terminal domain-containing protein n=1 Tax=Vibrio rumoiensis TaxID=76258 RepID=UPI000B5CA961|nr:type VI secretion system ImpA family N-terminal domain-containing protein [Vibrio rumoiensis]